MSSGAPYYQDDAVTIWHGDCLDVLRAMPDASVDSVVTDPPYGLRFMGRKWDYDVPAVEVWAECLRVLKPGGHLMAFAGTRTQHRMACRIEDAGFEIRDMIAWVYGSGFPKSLDVSKAIDAAAGAVRTEIVGRSKYEGRRPNAWGGNKNGNNAYGDYAAQPEMPITAPATAAARQWEGWGTALKPALEPITMARKPLDGTVAANVLEWGTGALNVDGCRVGAHDGTSTARTPSGTASTTSYGRSKLMGGNGSSLGRFPANLIHDGSAEVLALFPYTESGCLPSETPRGSTGGDGGKYGKRAAVTGVEFAANSGSAARFFYCAKASRRDRNEGLESGSTPVVAHDATMQHCETADWKGRNGNHHPTVKPTDLMRYLCRLVTPPGGIVLDPFGGSGSTGKAARRERLRAILIEREAEYCEIAARRCGAPRATQQEVLAL